MEHGSCLGRFEILRSSLRDVSKNEGSSPSASRAVSTHGTAGRERFRKDRDQWYFDRTGKRLSEEGSSMKEQGDAFDLLARNYRERAVTAVRD